MALCICQRISVILLSLCFMCYGNRVRVQAVTKKHQSIQLTIAISTHEEIDSCYIYRYHSNLKHEPYLCLNEMPITKFVVPGKKKELLFTDSMVAHNCTYYYYVEALLANKHKVPSAVVHASFPNIVIPEDTKQKVSFLIDKVNYFLELRFDGVAVKRYPISLGIKPHNRKICFDQSSTPEGNYNIAYFKPNSQFHKAMGVNYPTVVDYERYHRARKKGELPNHFGKVPTIGGSIQIHGGGIYGNWTWGCIAMRNDDIDELFSVKAMKVGSPIYIVGKEVTRSDLFTSIR